MLTDDAQQRLCCVSALAGMCVAWWSRREASAAAVAVAAPAVRQHSAWAFLSSMRSALRRWRSRSYGGSPGTHAAPPSRATIFNNIFRNYGHQWVYNFDELRRLAKAAGIDSNLLCRSDRSGRGLPRWVRHAMRRAMAPRNATQQCWLDQEVREGESMYAVAIKPLA